MLLLNLYQIGILSSLVLSHSRLPFTSTHELAPLIRSVVIFP